MKVVLKLSDPWEMGKEMGWPAISASVIRRDRDAWLVEIDQPFDYGGANYRYMVISPRLEGDALAQCASRSVPCNMIKTTIERASSASPCDISWWRGGHAMVGSIEAAQQADVANGALRGR